MGRPLRMSTHGRFFSPARSAFLPSEPTTTRILAVPAAATRARDFLPITNTSQEETNSRTLPSVPSKQRHRPNRPPQKRVAPIGAAHKLSYQLFLGVASTQRTKAGRGGPDCLPSTRPCEAVSEEGKVALLALPAELTRQRQALVVHHLLLKVRLRVVTHRAHLRRLDRHAGARSSGTSTPLRPHAQTPRPT